MIQSPGFFVTDHCLLFHTGSSLLRSGLLLQQGRVEGVIQVHDSAVHDVAFGAETVFVTCSADGSARVVDSRCDMNPGRCHIIKPFLDLSRDRFLWSVAQHTDILTANDGKACPSCLRIPAGSLAHGNCIIDRPLYLQGAIQNSQLWVVKC